MPEKDFIKRRKHPRVPVVSSAEIYRDGFSELLGYAVARNVSLGGVGLETSLILEVGKEYTLRFTLPTNEIITAYVEIMWRHPSLEGGVLLYGVKIKKISFFDKYKLWKYVKKKLKKLPPIK